MPEIIKNEDGTEREVYTKEELEAAADEKAGIERERLEAEADEERERLQAELKEKEEALKKLEDKDLNFQKLRNKKDKEEEESASEVKSEIAELNKKLAEIAEQPKVEIKTEFIKQNIGDDKEMLEKFEYYYQRLGSGAKTKDEVLRASKEALTLAGGTVNEFSNDQSMHSVGANQNYRQTPQAGVSEFAKKSAEALGLSEEDRKKYGGKK